MSNQTTRQFVRWSAENGTALLTIDRPPVNALSHQTKEEIRLCLEEISTTRQFVV